MGHLPLLDELALIAAVGVAVTVLLARFRLPAVAGLLAAGALVGPHGFALVKETHAIEQVAEVGVVLLLFTTGLEFSLEKLRPIWRQVVTGGLLQVGLTLLAGTGATHLLGLSWRESIFLGMVVTLSSTAIVLRALAERRELDAPHGRFITGVLVFQDLCVVPMVLLVPLLGSNGPGSSLLITELELAAVKTAAILLVTATLARNAVPWLFRKIDAARSRETFLMAVLALCTGTAWLTAQAGLSLALGAFLGGLLLADTEFGHRAMGDVAPLRDAFVSVFFLSLGMLFDGGAVVARPGAVGFGVIALVGGKALVATLAALAMKFPPRVAWLAGVGLAQFGEFGFVLVQMGQDVGAIDAERARTVLAAGVISMFFTPTMVRLAPTFRAGEALLAPLARLLGARSIDACTPEEERHLKGHVVIVGFGVAGRHLATQLTARGTPWLVLELNAENVRKARAEGLPVWLGDATSPEALDHAHLPEAKALVIVASDPAGAERIVEAARRRAPELPIHVRTRYLAERERLVRLGATEVVAEEWEAALALVKQV